jgi:flagellar FliJ protein
MKPFVFRASAALELRRRQDDEAQRNLGVARARRAAAEQRLEETRSDLERTFARGRESDARGDLSIREWYRNWIAAQRLELERCHTALVQREREVRDAVEHANTAHRKRKALERLYDLALAEWQDAARREEQKVIDELASVRYAHLRAGGRL